ncbi:hypothetical protein LJC36_00260 [Desulfovibrio sp. OttesenSCG-928-C14]|nr:hypothetical protein [Desulfovibrio sp. OttesenSCG-928-C14]
MAANILETFFILFASDAEDVDEGARTAQDSTDKLDKKLKETDRSAQKTGQSFTALARSAAGVLLPFVGLTALRGAVLDFAASADAAGVLARTLRMDVEELQAWQGAAVRAEGSAQGLAASVKNLNDGVREMRRTGGGEVAGVFYRLGVSIRDSEGRIKSADKLLLDLSDRFQGLSRERAIDLGEKMGLDDGTINLLLKGRKGIEELLARQRELGLYSKRDAEEARKFNNTMADLWQSFRSVGAIIGRALLPMFSGLAKGVTDVSGSIRKHRDLVTGFFIGLSLILGVLAIKAGIAFSPFFLFAAIILAVAAAFAILYDDVKAFLGGHDSLIGRLAKDYPWLADLVMDIVAVFQTLWGIVSAVGSLLLEAVNNPAQAWENFKNKVSAAIDELSERFPVLGQAIQDLGTIFSALFEIAWPVLKAIGGIVFEIIAKIIEGIATVGGWIGKALNWLAGKIRGKVDVDIDDPDYPDDPEAPNPYMMSKAQAAGIARAKQAVELANSPVSAMPHGYASMAENWVNRNTSVTIQEVTVQTQATDAEGISRDMGEALERNVSSALDNFDDGVAA